MSGDLKERLIATIQEELVHVEMAQLSLRKVARQLGVTAQAPYHHFGTKEALIQELQLRAYLGLNEIWHQVPQTEPSTERLEQLGIAFAAYCAEHIGAYKAMREVVPRTAALKEAQETSLQLLRQTCRQVVAERNIHRFDDESLTMLCWSSIHGLTDLYLLRMLRSGDSIAPLSRQLVQTITAMIETAE